MMTSCAQHSIAEDKYIKCSTCLDRSRKIEELEGMVTCKNDILSAQQNRLHSFETNYKRLFDDFERLRLDHSFALQDNCSLKEINLKLEQVTSERKKCTFDDKQELPANLDSGRITESPLSEEQRHSQESKKTSTIFEAQNYTSNINRNNRNVKKIQESGDNSDSSPNFKIVDSEKSLWLVIRDTMASNSKSILKTDKQTVTVNIEDPNLPMMVVDLKVHMKQQCKQFEESASRLVEQLDDMHCSNQVLADTLSVVTEENKNNLQIITDLKIQLKRVNEESETKTREMNKVIVELENEIEENKIIGRSLRNSINITENEVQKLQGALKEAEEQNCLFKNCKFEYGQALLSNSTQGCDEIDILRKELEEKKLELTEYEEENKHFGQTIEFLNDQNADLHTKIRQLEKELFLKDVNKKSEKSNETCVQIKSCVQMNIDDLKDQIKRLEQDKEYLTDKAKKHEMELYRTLSEMDRLKSTVITQMNELDQLSFENGDLRKQMEQLKRDNQVETDKLQKAVGKSQIQVEELLKEHDAKSNEINQVANELTNIRRNVTKDNDKYLGIIKNLEKEREDLQMKLKQKSDHSDCICGPNRAEFERLKTELFKKEATIFELELSINELTKSFKNFDKTAEDLAHENSVLKSDRDNYVRDLEALQAALSDKINELEEMRKKLENSDILCDKCMRAGKVTSIEKSSKYVCRNCVNLEMDMKLMKMDMEKLNQEKRKLEMSVADYYQLQMELNTLKGESHKRNNSFSCQKMSDLQKVYDELKYLYDRREKENEKLRNELINSEAQRGDSEKKCECFKTENKMLRAQTGVALKEASAIKEEFEQLQKTCASKSIDLEVLKDDLKAETEKRRKCHENCEGLKKKQATSEIELLEMREKLDELGKKYGDKTQELKKIKKQYDSCVKLSKISREEYGTLRNEYKEIKSMLADQLKKYKKETEKLDSENKKPCDIIRELRNQLMTKDRQMDQMQRKLKDASYEIIELKDHIHKLISDSNTMRNGMDALLGNLEKKIKGDPCFGSYPSNSAEAIAGEILQSLSNIEDIISKNPAICPKGCGFKNCDCMNQITSQYSFKLDHQQGPSRGFSASRSLNVSPKCKEVLHKVSSEPSGRSIPDSSRVTSESNTTDSDDLNADGKSLQFFKEAVVDLRVQIDKTMKEKNCDCKKLSAEKAKKQR